MPNDYILLAIFTDGNSIRYPATIVYPQKYQIHIKNMLLFPFMTDLIYLILLFHKPLFSSEVFVLPMQHSQQSSNSNTQNTLNVASLISKIHINSIHQSKVQQNINFNCIFCKKKLKNKKWKKGSQMNTQNDLIY